MPKKCFIFYFKNKKKSERVHRGIFRTLFMMFMMDIFMIFMMFMIFMIDIFTKILVNCLTSLAISGRILHRRCLIGSQICFWFMNIKVLEIFYEFDNLIHAKFIYFQYLYFFDQEILLDRR